MTKAGTVAMLGNSLAGYTTLLSLYVRQRSKLCSAIRADIVRHDSSQCLNVHIRQNSDHE